MRKERVKKVPIKEIGIKIRNLRTLRGITQGELARRANVDQSMVSKVENGTANPGVETIRDIATALGVSADELFTPDLKLAPLTDKIIMQHLDENLRQFIAKEDAAPYITMAKELYEGGFAQEELDALLLIFTGRKK